MINQKSKLPPNLIDNKRRRLLITLVRSVLFLFMAGVTGFLFRRRHCWNGEGLNYSQLPCQKCRQLNGCGRPTAEIYRNSRSTGKVRG